MRAKIIMKSGAVVEADLGDDFKTVRDRLTGQLTEIQWEKPPHGWVLHTIECSEIAAITVERK